MKKIISILLLLILITGCSSKNEKFDDSFLSFDTYIEFTAYTKDKETFDKYDKIVQDKFTYYDQLFDAYNNYKNVNNVKTINDNAGKKAVVVDQDLYYLIKESVNYYHNADKKNNIMLSPVINQYKIQQNNYENNKPVTNPSMSYLKELNKCTSMSNIQLNDKDHSIYLKEKCAQMDVGSVAKGYATDLIAEYVKKQGLSSGIINAGGNVSLIGSKNNKPFVIGIANPDDPNTYILTIDSENTNIVTSGDYQRYYMINGKRMNHIIDPDTLLPADVNRSVTIITDDGLKADYFSTECFMLDKEKIAKLAKKFNFEYIIIDKNEKITISDGIKDEVKIK
ncbi:MAG: FAD:protein FMN transferase [Bacilli bacterium]|jgi:thiamine biosynthesis lipoprotein|nr:FAD:protein FMN transferase [Bacilli bacterium]